jgi:hypothetical protein
MAAGHIQIVHMITHDNFKNQGESMAKRNISSMHHIVKSLRSGEM